MECYCFLRNVFDLLAKNSKTAYETRFNTKFEGVLIPFGAKVKWRPSLEKDKQQMHDFGSQVLDGVFAGYAQHAGGGWTGDVYVVPKYTIIHADHKIDAEPRRIKYQELWPVIDDFGEYDFPLATGEYEQPRTGEKVIRPKRPRGRPRKNGELVEERKPQPSTTTEEQDKIRIAASQEKQEESQEKDPEQEEKSEEEKASGQ